MACELGFDNRTNNDRYLSLSGHRVDEAAYVLRRRLEDDAKNERGHFDGINAVINIPLEKPLELKSVECKGWYQSVGSASVLVMACSNCRYRRD